jgi:hypothetical protein
MMRSKFTALLFVALCVFAALVGAQTSSATLVGRVTDVSHAPVSGATVTVRAVTTNETRTAQSQDNGEFTISDLQPTVYEVFFDKSGFKQLIEKNLKLEVGQTARLDAQLQIGAVMQRVEVEAEVPLLNTETSSRGDVITSRELTEMPLNGRDFNDLAFLVPGVQPAEQGGKGSPYVANGARPDASNVVIDGINDENPRDAGGSRPDCETHCEREICARFGRSLSSGAG